MNRKPELLCPAGSLKSMRYAFAYGADAVYAGQSRYSLRVKNNEFSHLNLPDAIAYAHERDKQFFLVSNILPHNNKVKTYIDEITPIIEAGPDALIMSDPGLIAMVREKWPEQAVHLSVQSNVVNYASVKFWQQVGVTRIILSREMSIREIAEIREACPDIELEVFVHGALCMAYSGRCLLSGYMNNRDANQGGCSNACRWKYKVTEADADNELGEPVVKEREQRTVFLEEPRHKGEAIQLHEDEHGTYMLNSKDLRAIHFIDELTKLGIDCFKIEGRTKSHFYTARTAQLYRQAIDDAVAGKPFNQDLYYALDSLANRGYTEGFFARHLPEEHQNYEYGSSKVSKQQFCGEVIEYDTDKAEMIVDVKNRFEIGDEIELMLPSGNQTITLDCITNDRGERMDVAPGSGHIVRIPFETTADMSYALMMRQL